MTEMAGEPMLMEVDGEVASLACHTASLLGPVAEEAKHTADEQKKGEEGSQGGKGKPPKKDTRKNKIQCRGCTALSITRCF